MSKNTSNLPARYVNTGESDSGGFGHVAFYKDTHLDRKVAIKSIKETSEQHRIIDELNALMQLRSKHVVQVFDRVIEDDDSMLIIEEFIAGEDLPIVEESQENYLKTIWQIASGIADIHSVGVIHRDIKPNNMKVDKEGIVKIFDFGLSRNEGEDAKTKGFKGTFCYAAPELKSSGIVEFSRAIDVYAFGITAIELSGLALPDELFSITPQPLPYGFLNNLPFKLPSDLISILISCLAFNPDNRPLMIEVRDKIARYLLKDKHQALAVYNGKAYVFNCDNRSASLNLPGIGNLTIQYDGLKFFVSTAEDEVFINNLSVTIGQEIPSSSVITLGNPERGLNRKFVTFDVSNPEIVL